MKTRTKQEEKNRAILAAAVKLLTGGDSGAVTMDAIAREAGVAKGTLFLYYPGKEALVEAAHAYMTDALRERLEKTLAFPLRGEDLLRALIAVLADHSARRRDLDSAGYASGCARGKFDQKRPKIAANMRLMADILVRCEKDGLLELSDPMYQGAALFGLCRSTITYCRVNGLKLSQKELADKVLSAYLYGTGKKK